MTIPSADLQQYAHLLVQLGVNLQPGQSLAIRTEPIHREFALLLAEVAYDAGAKFVAIEYSDMRLQSARIRKSTEEALEHVPGYVGAIATERRDDGWAAISLSWGGGSVAARPARPQRGCAYSRPQSTRPSSLGVRR